MNQSVVNKVNTWFFDLDGCVYYGTNLANRANELMGLLRSRGNKIGFITNNSRENAAEIRSKLRRMGLDIDNETIVSATEAVAVYLTERHAGAAVKVAGSPSLTRELTGRGHRLLDWSDTEVADIVIVGRDTEFDYRRLQQIANEMLQGARVISTNSDYSHPGEAGQVVPETGSLLAAIEAIAGTEAESVGKPHGYLYELAMGAYGVSPSECVMVGDNLSTDIAGAERVGMKSIWIGDPEQRRQGPDSVIPTCTVRNLSELCDLLLQQQGLD